MLVTWWTYISFVFSVATDQSDSDVEVSDSVEESGDLGIVGEDIQDYGDGTFSPAPGVDTVCLFPKNSAKGENFIYV